MMIKRYLFANRFYLIIATIAIFFILVSLLYGITQLEKQFEEKMLKITTSDIIKITQNISESIHNSLNGNQDYVKEIIKNQNLQKSIDQKLSLLLTENIKYAYLLYKDRNEVFRFLADGSPKEEKAQIKQKFDVESPKWQEIYKIKKPLLIKQPFLHQLSFTYLSPILKKEEVKLILAIDFSIKKTKDVNQIIDSVKSIIKFMIFTMVVFIVVLLIQVFKYYHMKKNSYTDKLTNLYNRNYFQDSIEYIDLSVYVLAILDIDHFKKINDTYGHSTGDIVLEHLAQQMRFSIRSKEDIIIRYGGEEFIFFIKKREHNDKKSPLNMIERIFTQIQKLKIPIADEKQLNITVSIGVNLYPGDSKNFKEAFKLADMALYKAKGSGRNQIVVYSQD